MKRFCITILAALLAFFSAVAFCHGAPPPLPGHPGAPHEPAMSGGLPGLAPPCADIFLRPEIAAYLNLTKEQMNRIASLEDRIYRETRELKYRLAVLHLEMRRLYADPGVGENDLHAKIRELNALGEKLHGIMASGMISARSILTPDQIGKLDRLPPPPFPPRDMGVMKNEFRR